MRLGSGSRLKLQVEQFGTPETVPNADLPPIRIGRARVRTDAGQLWAIVLEQDRPRGRPAQVILSAFDLEGQRRLFKEIEELREELRGQ